MVSRSRKSPSMNPAFGLIHAGLPRLCVFGSRLSSTRTFQPSRTRRSVTCEPIRPAPPVTRARLDIGQTLLCIWEMARTPTWTGERQANAIAVAAGPTRLSRLDFLIAFALTVATLAIYSQVFSHRFIQYDDDLYVTSNRVVQAGLSL